MTINLSNEMDQFVKELVVTGKYPSEAEAVAEGLRLLMSREQLKEGIAKGVRALDEGRWHDEETVFAVLEKDLDDM
jgi:putative addiction module CopG family antidote